MAIVPFMSKQMLTGMGRNTSIFALALVLVPMLLPTVPATMPHAADCVLLAIKEVVIGILIGFLGSFFFYTVQSMGFVIDMQRGASMGSVFDPLLGEQTSLVGSLLSQLAMTIFFVGGAFYSFMTIIYESYKLWPVFASFPVLPKSFSLFFLQAFDEMFVLIMAFVGPMIFVMFLAELGMGLITRFAPQLNVFFLAMPIKSGIAMFFLMLYCSMLAKFFNEQFIYNNNMLQFFMVFFK